MPSLRTKQELARIAQSFALMADLVKYRGHLYMPVHFMSAMPAHKVDDIQKNQVVWKPLSTEEIVAIGNTMSSILFATDGEVRSYILMLKQFATPAMESNRLLVRMGDTHVEMLQPDGSFAPADGEFVPNYLDVPYVPDGELTKQLYATVIEWVGGEENAKSLLHHLATILQPGWSAARYVLLLGSGRNGKSTLLKMLLALFGEDNISGITRQDMAGRRPIISELNGKLANIVLDGPKEFLKDSSTEKTLVVGERLKIEMKYENSAFTVQTNALFIEGLQQEPKVSDKSSALQARLVRFKFPNKYPLNLGFEAQMLRPEMLAAMLDLLIRHWVMKDEIAAKLSVTADSMDLQMQAVWTSSPILRFLEYTAARDRAFLQKILDQQMIVDVFLFTYRPWLEANGYKNMEDDYLMQQIGDHFVTDRKTFRIDKKPTTKRYIKSCLDDTNNAINTLLLGGTLEHSEEDQAILSD
ncbi:DNA primase [Microbacterium phage Fede]|nr:DNA primase [Microbacterium phage Fede]